MDTVHPSKRSEIMGRVKSKDTRPEMIVRKVTHSMGYKYQLYYKELPGKPDLVFKMRRKVIFVHGCFWHRHENCKLARLPKSRLDFWEKKLSDNKARDERTVQALTENGWGVLIVWECELGDLDSIRVKIRKFLESNK